MSEETKEPLQEEQKEEKVEEANVENQAQDTSSDAQESSGEEMSTEDLMAMWEEALKEAQAAGQSQEQTQETTTQQTTTAEPAQKETLPTQPANLEELTPAQGTGIHPELDFILDIPLEVTVEIGRTKMMIRELLKLNQGSIIELEKFVGEPVEVLVNGKLMAKGEVVVVNDRFGVRITEIISAKERIKKLGS
ncbi:MAG: flagellar motor switch protein FliN [Thermodesulfobacteria bacterium]|nr:flagellar motor switch protein FliN [Thermodesulfobacteriota bacterium]